MIEGFTSDALNQLAQMLNPIYLSVLLVVVLQIALLGVVLWKR